MAELRTPGGRTGGEPPFDPPRGDEGLDDWFARRLEAQGIRARRPRIPVARVLALGALAAAIFIFGWVLQSASGGSSSVTTTTPPTHHNTANANGTTPPGGTGTVPAKHARAQWKQIPLTVLNGFGGANAAATAQSQLRAAGWHVVSVADASHETQSTIVVYVPGKLAQARIVAHRLGLPPPVPIASAPGVLSTQTDGVAIVLGPNLLPNGAG
jgi:LytR cell envelope-related transcriptional attenuator